VFKINRRKSRRTGLSRTGTGTRRTTRIIRSTWNRRRRSIRGRSSDARARSGKSRILIFDKALKPSRL